MASSQSSDFAIAPLIAILSPFANALIDSIGSNITSALSVFPGEHTVMTSAFSPPYDQYPRNISAWLADGVTIGGEQFDEIFVGGPSKNSNSFNPGVLQWNTGNAVGFITVGYNLMSFSKQFRQSGRYVRDCVRSIRRSRPIGFGNPSTNTYAVPEWEPTQTIYSRASN